MNKSNQLICFIQAERLPEFRIVAVRARDPFRAEPQRMNCVQDIHRRRRAGKYLLDFRNLVARYDLSPPPQS